MTDKELEKLKNKANALGKKKEFNMKYGEIDHKHSHYLHPQLSFGVGSVLIVFGFLASEMFFLVYLYGLIYTSRRYIKITTKRDNRFLEFVSNHPKYFFLGGALTYVMFRSQGYKIGELNGLTVLALKMLGL